MLMTTPFLRPDAGTVPWPMIVIRPSRLTSPMSAQTLLVPTSMPTRTASRSTVLCSLRRVAGLQEVTPDERHVIQDAQPERDERYQIEIQTKSIADERQEDRDDRVDEEPADEDPIVVDPVEFRPDRSEDRIERCQDRDGRIAAELEADVDVEDESRKDADEEPEQGKQHAVVALVPVISARLLDGASQRQPGTRCSRPAWRHGFVLGDGVGVALGTYVPSVSDARMTRSMTGSRPMTRLRRSRTCPGMS